MGKEDSSKAQAIRQAYAQARQMKNAGAPREMIQSVIEKKLIEQGFNEKASALIAGNLPEVSIEGKDSPEIKKRNMIIGSGLFFSGFIISIILESISWDLGLGYYVVSYVPMIAGIGLVIKGFIDYKRINE